MVCSGREINAWMREAGSAKGFSVGDGGKTLCPIQSCWWVFLATDFGWDLPHGRGRGFHRHETWNPSRPCSGLSPHLTLHALAPRKDPGIWDPSCPN